MNDRQGAYRDDCVISTDVSLAPERIVSLSTRRWSIKVTYEEVHAHLGFETMCQRSRKSVLRAAPCLLGLFGVVSLAFHTHARRHKVLSACAAWYDKPEITFSDAIAAIRADLWRVTVFRNSNFNDHIAKSDKPARTLLFHALAYAT